jgi:AcrR family transcriptional regulator
MKSMSDSIKQPGRPRDESVRLRIQKAAIELLIEGGFLNLTCDAIALRSGASKATIYRWWPNKVQIMLDAFIDALSPQLRVYPAATLEEFIDTHIRQFIRAVNGQNGKLLAAVLAAAQVVPELHQAYLTYWLKPRRDLLRKALLRFQASGELSSNIDIDVALDTLYGPLHMLLMVQRNRLKPAYATQLTPIILRGIRNSAK